MKRPERIALYGGTFDPVHRGHLAVAERLAELFGLDQVIFIPAYVAPHKRHTAVTPALDRYAMLALATQDEPRFCASTVELDAPERPYTVETLTRLRALYGDAARLLFVMGADSWGEITTWREWERLLVMTDHLVVTRPGYNLGTGHVTPAIRERVVDLRGASREACERALAGGGETRIYLTDAVMMEIASTAVRRAAARGDAEIDRLLPPAVADYVRKYRLYRDVHETEFSDTRPAHS